MATKLKKILIIEDEKPMAKALELKLKHEGFDSHSVHDGQAGLDKIKSEKFDLILSDLMMPNMSGFQLLEELKAKKDNTPVIILTNLSQEEDKKTVMALGAKGFFVKSNTPISNIVSEVKKIFT